MTKTVLKSRVGADGVLTVSVPLSAEDANREVTVTIEPVSGRQMTQEEYSDWVMKVAGSIDDASFRRHEQGQYERREELP
jgi:hypothetical protein